MEEVIKEKNKKIGFEGLRNKKTDFIHFKQKEGGGSFESPIIEIKDKYVKKYLYT